MANIIHRVGFKAEAKKVYQALSTISGLANWWTEKTSGKSEVGGEITFTFETLKGEVVGEMKMKVTNLDPNKKVEWVCLAGPPDWIGTNFTFELSTQDDYTILIFGHRNWKEESESKAHCNMKWGVFMMSLKDYIEKGKGKPSPSDIKIDNWN